MDALTKCIRNRISGDSFSTEVLPVSRADLKPITKKNGWNFNWKSELEQDDRKVYKLIIIGNESDIIHGLVSLSIRQGFMFLNLIESAPFNLGSNKLYEGVPGNLVAFACRLSFQSGFEGFVSFIAKTKLIGHYERTLGAKHFGNGLMVIETDVARKLVDTYFKN